MKEIQLSQGCVTMVDDEDFEALNQFKWGLKKFKNVCYARRFDASTEKWILMHRVIAGVTDSSIMIDHKDRDGLNNQKDNLRTCSRAQNRANSKSWGMSKFLGVTIKRDRYVAVIFKNRKATFLGSFPLTVSGEKKAAEAYDKAAKERYGEFANPNIKEAMPNQ